MAKGVRTIDKDKFFKALYSFYNGEISLRKAAKYVGISIPTLTKYFNMVLLEEELPDNLFEKK